ncbi:ATP-binding protein [Patescibacteria group bacterium AH-259-L07]|nr:ATP-binding protein [Patescibacteria group bacterium AH-259-L07]
MKKSDFLHPKKSSRMIGLNIKLLIIFVLLSILPISIIGFVSVSRTTNELQREAVTRLKNFSQDEAEKINLVLSKISSSSKNLADYATHAYNNTDLFYSPEYWTSDEKLFQGSEGQYGNDADDTSSVIVFNWFNLNENVKRDLDLSANLDFIFPSIKAENKNIDNLYIIGGNYGWYRLYPNADPDPSRRGGFAIDVLPADLNAEGVDPVFWDNLNEINNSDKYAQWTPPYVDVTGHGLMVSSLAPVYTGEKMTAITGIDFKLEDITNRVLDIKLWKTGYAFMIDAEGRPISFPIRAQPDLEYVKEKLEISEIREFNLENVSNEQLGHVIKAMKAGFSGIRIVDFINAKKYVAYYPIANSGWSLGLVVPVNEVIANALATRNFIVTMLGAVILVLLILIVLSSRFVTAPIKALTRGAEEISKGNLSYQINIKTGDEIQTLAEGFNEMARKLKKYYATLEQKVKERTAQLVQAKSRIEQEKNRIEAILVSIADGVLVIDTNRKLILINPSVERITGFSQDECVGKPYNEVFKFLKEDDKKENIEFIENALTSGELSTMYNHTVLVKKDGVEMPAASSAAAIRDEKGTIIGGVAVFRDITKEREMDRIKSEFVSLASHQLRTPVTIIKWGTETLLKGLEKKLTKKEMEQLQRIYRGSSRMIELVNDLLNVSRLESKRLVFKTEEVQFEELIDKVIEEYQPYLEKKKAKLSYKKPDTLLPKVTIDPEKIRQVIIILLDNAIKYSPEGSEIKLKIEQHDHEIVYSTADSGVGIPKKQEEKIFSRFFRAENVSQKPGTGLGLYLAKGLIEASGGKIWFDSVEGKGTTFFFTLPTKK